MTSLQGYDGQSYVADPPTLVPFEGYFIHNSAALPETLWVQPKEAQPLMPGEMLSKAGASALEPWEQDDCAGSWMLRIDARTDKAVDRGTSLGVHCAALQFVDAAESTA